MPTEAEIEAEARLEWEAAQEWKAAQAEKSSLAQANRAGDTLRELSFADKVNRMAEVPLQAATGIAQGLGQTGGLLGDVAAQTQYLGEKYLEGKKPEEISQWAAQPFGHYASQMGDIVGRIPGMAGEPQTAGQRALRQAGEFLGPAVIPGGMAAKAGKYGVVGGELLSALTGGYGSEAAKSQGASPLVQMIAGTIAGGVPALAGRAGTMAFNKLLPGVTKEGAEANAARALKRMSSSEDLAGDVAALPDETGVMAGYRSVPERLDDPGLTKLQSQLSASERFSGEAADALKDRQAARLRALSETVEGKPVDYKQAGTPIRERVIKEEADLRKLIDETYKQVDPEGTSNISIFEGKKKIQDHLEERYRFDATKVKEGGRLPADIVDTKKIKSDTKELLKEVIYGPRERSFKDLQNIRGDINDVMSVTTKPKEQALLQTMKTSIDADIKTAAKTGKGFTSDQVGKLKEAQRLRIKLGQRFEEGFGKTTLLGTKTGRAVVDPEKLVTKAMDSERSAREALAAIGPDKVARRTLQAGIVDKLKRRSLKENDVLSPAKFNKNLETHKEAVSTIFNPTQVKRMKQIAEDLHSGETRAAQLSKTGAKYGSDTAPRLSSVLAYSAAKGATGNSLLGRLARTVPGLKGLLTMNQDQVDELVWTALNNNETMAALVKPATYNNIKKLGKQFIKDEAIAGLVSAQQAYKEGE